MYYAFDGQDQPPRAGASHSTIYPYGPFAAADGSVMLGLQNEREWQAFCEHVLKQPKLTDDTRFANNSQRSANRDDLRAIIHAAFAELDTKDVLARLDSAGIANARVSDMADVWNHAQLAARNRWRTIDSPAGALPARSCVPEDRKCPWTNPRPPGPPNRTQSAESLEPVLQPRQSGGSTSPAGESARGLP